MQKREYWIDELKAFAMLCVVFEHSLMRTIAGLDLTDYRYIIADNFFKSFYMPLFFLASGYVYALADRKKTENTSVKDYSVKKIWNLMLPYIIIAVPVWAGKFVFSNWVTNKVGLMDLAMMFLNPVAFMWFIYILFYVQILVFIMDKKLYKKSFVILLILLTMNLSRIFINTDIKLLDRILWYPLYYYMGVIIYEKKNRICIKSALITTAGALLFLFMHLKYIDTVMDNIVFCRMVNIMMSLFFAEWFYILRNKVNHNTFFAWIGSITLYIYVLHPIVLDAIRVVLWRTGIKSVAIWIPVLFIGSSICSIAYYVAAGKWILLDIPFKPKRIRELFEKR